MNGSEWAGGLPRGVELAPNSPAGSVGAPTVRLGSRLGGWTSGLHQGDAVRWAPGPGVDAGSVSGPGWRIPWTTSSAGRAGAASNGGGASGELHRSPWWGESRSWPQGGCPGRIGSQEGGGAGGSSLAQGKGRAGRLREARPKFPRRASVPSSSLRSKAGLLYVGSVLLGLSPTPKLRWLLSKEPRSQVDRFVVWVPESRRSRDLPLSRLVGPTILGAPARSGGGRTLRFAPRCERALGRWLLRIPSDGGCSPGPLDIGPSPCP